MSVAFDPTTWQGKTCASCEHWGGARVDEQERFAVANSYNDRGLCTSRRCRNDGKLTYANNKNCEYWEKWANLR